MCSTLCALQRGRALFGRTPAVLGTALGRWANGSDEQSSCSPPVILAQQQHRLGSAHAAKSSGAFAGVLTKTQAKELAVRLTSEERQILIAALQEFQSQKLKAEYEESLLNNERPARRLDNPHINTVSRSVDNSTICERGQLAAFRWRSKFGRPSKVVTLGDVDPTGSYCAVPDDWLLRKYAETVPQPTRSDLIRVLVWNAIPFVGFGFLDNFIMILAGDWIEATLGSFITLSTMAAAACGNTISDVLGIGSAFYVELFAQKIGFEPPKLTPIQLDLPKSRTAANSGRVIGVIIGCTLGMSPLIFLHKESKDDKKDEDELEVVEAK